MRRPLHLVTFVVLTACGLGCASEPRSAQELLKQAARESDPQARSALVERFLEVRGGNPVVDQNARLTFFVKDDPAGRIPRIFGDLTNRATTAQGYDPKAGTPVRIEGTPWSYVETTAFTNARLEYVFLYEKDTAPDPRNTRKIRTFSGERSEIRMPFFSAHPEVEGPAPDAKGTLTEQTFESRALKASRRVWTYLPAGYEASQDIYPTVYFLDGGNYTDWMAVPAVLDRLIAAKTIPPVIAVFVEPGSRQAEFSPNPAWRAFVAPAEAGQRYPAGWAPVRVAGRGSLCTSHRRVSSTATGTRAWVTGIL